MKSRTGCQAYSPPSNHTMLQESTLLAVCVATGAFLVWHCRALHSWLRNLRALALLPHPAPELWLWGNAQALTRPDFHRLMLQHATEFGAIFSMRLIWFKARSAASGRPFVWLLLAGGSVCPGRARAQAGVRPTGCRGVRPAPGGVAALTRRRP